ncbi:MAG: response regulator [Burkholderiales bacterium]|nr:response regulator [Burkholderiales bacterium]
MSHGRFFAACRCRVNLGSKFWLYAILLAIGWCFTGLAYSQDAQDGALSSDPSQNSPKVLILSAFGQGWPGVDTYINTLVGTLKSTGFSGNDIFVEYLDLGRNAGPEYRLAQKRLLTAKYQKRRINLVFTLLQPALNFLLLDTPELVPDAPVVAVLGEVTPNLPRGRHRFVQIAQDLDYQASLKQALSLFPSTRRVVLVSGTSEEEIKSLAKMRAALALWRDKIAFTDTTGLSIEEAERHVAALPPQTIIFNLGVRRDKTGRNFVPAEALEKIARKANAPIFVLYDIGIGSGHTGGYIFSIKNEGVRAATVAFEIVNGTFALNEPITRLNAEQISMYDWQQLERWSADPDKLPRDTIFINRPPTLWGQYRNTVLATAGAFLLLTLLIASLMWQIRRKALAEEALVASQERYRTLVEEAPEAILVYDADLQRIIELNSKAERLFERSREDLLQIELRQLYAPISAGDAMLKHSIEENAQRALGGESLVFERTVRTKSGRDIPCQIWLARLPAKGRNLLRASIIDITDRKNAEAELRSHRQRLEEQVAERTAALSVALTQAQAASRAKSTFLSHMSHEIRTPMNAILGYTQLMERMPELTGKLKDYAAVIARSGDHLMALINDVLEMSKIEAGGVTLSRDNFNIRAMLKDIDSMFKMRAFEKGLKLDFGIDDSVPENLCADATKVRQVLVNILGNAIKFTDDGGIKVAVSARKEEGPKIFVGIIVTDTGPGIPEHEQAKVFEAFEQTESGNRKGGTGLGMAISRQYARMMDGDVSLQSSTGKGTAVRFSFIGLPGEGTSIENEQIETGRVAALAQDSVQPKILIVDDIESNRDILRLMLSGIGISAIREEAGGKDLAAVVDEWRPDIVLMDRRMPGIDGLAATRMIRALPKGNEVRIIMVSAGAFEEERRLAFAAGIDGFVGKPFREQEIFAEIQRVFPAIVYRYENETTSARNGNGDLSVDLGGLDGALAAELMGLIENGDVLRFEKCLDERLREQQPYVYERLHELVQRFDYARILALLKPRREQS